MEKVWQNETKWQRITYMPGTPVNGREKRVTGGEEHRTLSRQAAREGMVLLKNEGALLPFASGQKLAIFGKAQADYVQGGGGSGDVTVARVRSLLDGFAEKEAEGKAQVFAPLSAYYAQNVAQQRAAGANPGQTVEPPVPDDLLAQARAYTDTALVTICRFSGEAWDRTGEAFDGDYYLSREERAMVDRVVEAFPRVAVVLNVGGIVDTAWFRDEPRIQAALMGWQAGMEGGMATADLLCGDACPSGCLTDTFATDFAAYPSSAGFAESEDYVAYEDDIYVGYRYFETIPGVAEKVCYPFGFGLSYTSFDFAETIARREGEDIVLEVTVINTGDCAGRKVAQAYCRPPQGLLGKPSLVLTGFAKTALLKPGESERLTIRFPLYRFASYDDTGRVQASSWLLEKGEYRFFVGGNVRDLEPLTYVLTLEQDEVLATPGAKCVPHDLKRRLRPDGSYEAMPPSAPGVRPMDKVFPKDGQRPVEWCRQIPGCAWAGEGGALQLKSVLDGELTLDEFVDKLSDEEKIHLLGGQPNRGVANTFGFGNLPEYGVPNAMTADGPAGLRIRPEAGVTTTSFPCATLLACSWDEALLFRIGQAIAEETHENGIGIWLAPAVNIHRTPLCGRNFEYYSEDPLVAGTLAASLVRGVQSLGVATSLKHFACNNKETNRRESDSRLSERALREIYLKAFEIIVKTAQPWTLMTSYNLINSVRASENRELLTGILRGEWGFEGVVTTDWYTHGEQYLEIAAGNDIKMGCGAPEHTLEKLREGALSAEDVTDSAKRVLALLLKLA